MDYKWTCKRRHLLDVVSQLNRNRLYIELKVKVTIIHATPENYRHIQTYLNAFLGNVLCYIFMSSYRDYFWPGTRRCRRTNVCWVWSNFSLTSKNLAHHLIHFKVIHRAYITPYKRFKMKLQPNFNCHICNTASSGTFLHMFWECPVVISLWTHVNLFLSSLLQIDWLVNPSLCLLNDDSGLCISSIQKRMLFAGFTSAKKTIIQNWFTPHVWKNILDP